MSYSKEDLERLIKLSKLGSEQMNTEMKKFDLVFQGLLKNAPEEDIEIIEKINILSKKAISLAKQGKTEESNKVIQELKNLRK